MKPLVVISEQNPASQNIKSALLQMESFEEKEAGFWASHDFDMAQYGGSIVDIVPAHDAKYYIFASTHRSASGAPSLTVQTPGNWGAADLGGAARTLNIAYAAKVKSIAQTLSRLCPQLPGWQVSVEVDHHGPSLSKPVLFAEIGSGEKEWGVPLAGRIVAQAIVEAVQSKETWPAYVGFGGTHYAPKFTPMIIGSQIALGHIISGYALERNGCDEQMIAQAIERCVEKPEGALVDWKGIKKGPKGALIAALETAGVEWKKA